MLLVPWVLGFVAYQLINPGCDRLVGRRRGRTSSGWLHFTPQSWMSASIISFLVAGLLTLAMGPITGRRPVAVEPVSAAPAEVGVR